MLFFKPVIKSRQSTCISPDCDAGPAREAHRLKGRRLAPRLYYDPRGCLFLFIVQLYNGILFGFLLVKSWKDHMQLARLADGAGWGCRTQGRGAVKLRRCIFTTGIRDLCDFVWGSRRVKTRCGSVGLGGSGRGRQLQRESRNRCRRRRASRAGATHGAYGRLTGSCLWSRGQ